MPNKNFNDLTIATTTDGTELVPVVSSGVTSAISVSNINSGIIADTISDVTNADDLSVGQSSIAAGVSSLVSSITQQDLTGVNTVGLHRNSSAAVTSMFIYDTSKDSDGGAWTEKCQHTSWYNEPLSGKWLGAQSSEIKARNYGSVFGSELVTNPTFTSASGWTVDGDWSIDTTNNWAIRTSGGTGYLYQQINFTAGKLYRIQIFVKDMTVYLDRVTLDTYLQRGNVLAGTPAASDLMLTDNGYEFYFAPTTSNGYIALWGSTFRGKVVKVSVKEVISQTTQSNDYYQNSTDGKFYRLWKNLISYSEELGDTSWNGYGATISSNSGLAPNGTWTADRVLARTDNTFQSKTLLKSNSVSVTAGTTYAFSIYAKSDGVRYFSLSGDMTSVLFGPTATYFDLQTQTVTQGTGYIVPIGDGWYRCIAIQTATTTGIARPAITLQQSGTGSAYGQNNWIGDGISGMYFYGAQIEKGSVATTYESKGNQGSVSEVFRGNKKSFPKLSAFIEESGNLTVYDLTESGRPMWIRFDKAGSFRMSMGIGVANGTFSGYNVSTAIQIVSFCYDSVRFINSSGNYLYGNIANRNLTTFNAVLDSTTKVLSSNSRAYKTYVYATSQSTSISGNVLPNATVFNLNNTTIDVFRSNGSYLTLGGANTSNSLGLPVRIRNSDFLYLSKFDAGATKLYYLNNPELKSNNPTNLIPDISTSEFSRAGLPAKFISDDKSKFYKFVSGYPLVEANQINIVEPTKTISSAITNTYNTGHQIGDIRRTYLSDVVAEVVTGQDVISDPTFQYGIGDWSGVNATISTTGPGNLRATVITSSQPCGFTKTLTGLIINRTYRIIFGFSNLYFDNGSGANFYQGSIQINGSTIYNFSRISAYDEFVFTATNNTATLTILSGYNYYAYWDLKYIYVTQAAPERSYKGAAGSYNIGTTHIPALITGTLTKTPVATGSQLVAYSGFSA